MHQAVTTFFAVVCVQTYAHLTPTQNRGMCACEEHKIRQMKEDYMSSTLYFPNGDNLRVPLSESSQSIHICLPTS